MGHVSNCTPHSAHMQRCPQSVTKLRRASKHTTHVMKLRHPPCAVNECWAACRSNRNFSTAASASRSAVRVISNARVSSKLGSLGDGVILEACALTGTSALSRAVCFWTFKSFSMDIPMWTRGIWSPLSRKPECSVLVISQ